MNEMEETDTSNHYSSKFQLNILSMLTTTISQFF